MEELGFMQCPRDRAAFRIGTWRSDDWAVCGFWVDDETRVGPRCQLDPVAAVFSQKYGISGERELRWNLGMGLNRDCSTHITSLSQGEYIDKLMERFVTQNANTFTTPLVPGATITKTSAPRRLRDCKTYLATTIEDSSVLYCTSRLPRDQASASPSASPSRTLVMPTWR